MLLCRFQHKAEHMYLSCDNAKGTNGVLLNLNRRKLMSIEMEMGQISLHMCLT